MQEKVFENLVRFYNDIEGTYDIYASVKDWEKIVYLGYSYKDRLNILKMLYLNNCRLEDLQNMSLSELLDYIKETDDEYEKDKKYIDKCVALICMYDND